jgi:AcrR family transcriptional regulator
MFILNRMKDALKPQPPSRQRLNQDERRSQTRQHFLDAARTLFARQGFAGTTLDQISEQAGYSRGAFHHNFSSKEDLLLSLIRACFEADIRTLVGLQDANQSRQAEEFQAHGGNTPINREYHLLKLEFWVCALRLPHVGEVYSREFAAYRLVLADLISPNAASSDLSPEQLAAVVLALSNGLDTQRLIDPDAIPIELYSETLNRIVALKFDG